MPRPSPRHTRRLTRSKLARRACGNTAATGHYQHRLAADPERAAAPQVPRISTGLALACGTVKEGVSTMPAPSLRAEPLVTVSAVAARRRAVSRKTGASACARSPWMRWRSKTQRHAYVC